MTICISPKTVLTRPWAAGHAWVNLNWALGLQANGYKVIWMEPMPQKEVAGGVDEAVDLVRGLRNKFDEVGLEAEIALDLESDIHDWLQPVRERLGAMTLPVEAAYEQSELLVNLDYRLPQKTVDLFKKSALLDIDPGLLQLWVAGGHINLAAHRNYFSIGETVGRPDALFPDCDRRWHYTPPALFLPQWPNVAIQEGSYSTISGWWSGWLEAPGNSYENSKRIAFQPYFDLPSRVNVELELALAMANNTQDVADCSLLKRKGWRVRSALEVSSELDEYRSYIQRSRGEFSCARPSCWKLQNAWISDRTLCYLASGKPAVVQDTGPSRILPRSEGLLRFADIDEAARCLEDAESDYERHCRAARALAAEHFDAQKVAKNLLETALT